MIERTDDEIRAEVQRLWPDLNLDESAWSDYSYFVIDRRDNGVALTITAMYDNPGLSFDQIEGLAKFFDTKNVETEEEVRSGGCESCDYGSKLGVVLLISPGDGFTASDSEK